MYTLQDFSSVSRFHGSGTTSGGVTTSHSHGAGILVHSNKLSFLKQIFDIVCVCLSRSQYYEKYKGSASK
jgi:hypothetical protein